MTAEIIDGKAIAAELRTRITHDVAAMVSAGQAAPALHVILCGDDPASATYVRNKGRAAAAAGVELTLHTPAKSSTTADICALLDRLNADDAVDGILVQLPLPAQIEQSVVVNHVDPAKDADGFHPFNFGQLAQGATPLAIPCTPAGCMELIRRTGITIAGARAVVIGRSTIVGRPMAVLLTNADATVTVCHSRTVDLPAVCREADILVAAMGRPGTIDASYVKPGACVIDVGTTPRDGQVFGDIDRASVELVAGWLTPVPGGVGPMTITMLLRNTVALAQRRRGAPV